MIQNKKKMFRLSNTARKIFWVARIFDATLPNFTNGRAIAPPAPLSPTPMLLHYDTICPAAENIFSLLYDFFRQLRNLCVKWVIL